MSTVERAFTAMAIVLSVLLFALTVALRLSASNAVPLNLPSRTGADDTSRAGFVDVNYTTCTITTGESGSGPTVGATGPWEQPWCTTDHKNPTAALTPQGMIIVHNKLSHSCLASTPPPPAEPNSGSLGKVFWQLILTISLFLIAAANHKGSRCVMMGFLPFHDFISSPPVKHIHSRLSLTVRPFFINFSTNWSTKSSRGDQDDDDAEEAEDNAGPVDSLTSLGTNFSSRSLRNPIKVNPSHSDSGEEEEASLPLGHGFLVGALPNPNRHKPWMEASDTTTNSKEMIHRARPSWRIKAGDPGGGGDAGGINSGSVTHEIKPYELFCVPTDKNEESHEKGTPIDIYATAFTGADVPKAPVIIPRPPDDERLMSDKHISLKAQNSLKKLKRTEIDTKKELYKERRLAVKKKVRDKLCNLLCCCGSSSEVDVV